MLCFHMFWLQAACKRRREARVVSPAQPFASIEHVVTLDGSGTFAFPGPPRLSDLTPGKSGVIV